MWNEQEYESFAKKMEESFPKMFSGRYGGFAVGAGWWPIIEALSGQIQSYIDWKNRSAEAGYKDFQPVNQVVVEQVKEKFGGLRFYYTGGDEQIHGMVRMAESWAAHTCEECGHPGKSRGGGWIKTLCDKHDEERKARYKKEFGDDN